MSSDANDIVLSPVEGGVTAAAGFSASGVSAGLKKRGALDVALVACDHVCPTAGLFTTNKVAAAPVVVSRRHVADGHARAVVINAGNANACTGAEGEAAAIETAAALARLLGCSGGDIVVSSTGVIGVQLPVGTLLAALPSAVDALDREGGASAAAAIMTTDTVAKEAAVRVEAEGRTITVGGMAKGSGMIAPNMATMLSVVTTDAPLTAAACDAALRAGVAVTFNRVTIDSDTSTNDMVVLMASGAAGGEPIEPGSAGFSAVGEGVRVVCEELARMIARDGEGATKLITVTVRGAANDEDAEKAAFAIADSPLVKTAIFGADANWGRVAMAIGKSGCELDPSAFDITFAGIDVCRAGAALAFDEAAAAEALSLADVEVEVNLNLGEGSATVWTGHLTCEYVRINGEYRS